jgi:cyclophilin family peptidyl-prolyl cis-trans isomerase
MMKAVVFFFLFSMTMIYGQVHKTENEQGSADEVEVSLKSLLIPENILVQATSQRQVGLILSLLEHGQQTLSVAKRRQLILAIGQIGDPRGVPVLLSNIHDARFQKSCLFALGECGFGGSYKGNHVLEQLLTLEVYEDSRLCWFEALGKLDRSFDSASRDLLWRKWGEFPSPIKDQAFYDAWKFSDNRYENEALKLVYGPNPGLGAVYFLSRKKVPVSISEMIRLMHTFTTQPDHLITLLKCTIQTDQETGAGEKKGTVLNEALRSSLIELLNSPDWRVRVEAVRVLIQTHLIKQEDYSSLLDDPNPNVVKSFLARILKTHEDDRVLMHKILRRWTAFSHDLKWVVLKTVPEIRERWMTVELSSWVKSKSDWMHYKGISGMKNSHNESVEKILDHYFRRGNSVEKVLALDAAMDTTPDKRLSLAEKWLKNSFASPDPFLFAFALDHASDMGVPLTEQEIEQLRDKLVSEDDVQYFSLKPLMKVMGDTEFTGMMETLLHSPHYAVRLKAAEALGLPDYTEVFRIPWQTHIPDGLLKKAAENIVRKSPLYWTLRTGKGDIVIRMFPRDAPVTCASIERLSRQKYFKQMPIHRVVPNFVVQAGDSRGDGSGGPGYVIPCEINAHPYLRGSVGMALAGKDTGGSQFFICHSAQPHLDGGYTVFGEVVLGMAVVDVLGEDDAILSATVKGSL